MASLEVSPPGLLMYDWMMGMNAAIELCTARALELAITPIGFKVVDVIWGTKSKSDVWEGPLVIGCVRMLEDFLPPPAEVLNPVGLDVVMEKAFDGDGDPWEVSVFPGAVSGWPPEIWGCEDVEVPNFGLVGLIGSPVPINPEMGFWMGTIVGLPVPPVGWIALGFNPWFPEFWGGGVCRLAGKLPDDICAVGPEVDWYRRRDMESLQL